MMTKDAKQSLIAVASVAVFFASLYALVRLTLDTSIPRWLPFAGFLLASAALAYKFVMWLRGKWTKRRAP
jgi:protein-S-isoprenylcysteine O-methyltransferase Ste14